MERQNEMNGQNGNGTGEGMNGNGAQANGFRSDGQNNVSGSSNIIDEETLAILKEIKQKKQVEKLESAFFTEDKAPLKEFYDKVASEFEKSEMGFKAAIKTAQVLLKESLKKPAEGNNGQNGQQTETQAANSGNTSRNNTASQNGQATNGSHQGQIPATAQTGNVNLNDAKSVVSYFKGQNVDNTKLQTIAEFGDFSIFTN